MDLREKKKPKPPKLPCNNAAFQNHLWIWELKQLFIQIPKPNNKLSP